MEQEVKKTSLRTKIIRTALSVSILYLIMSLIINNNKPIVDCVSPKTILTISNDSKEDSVLTYLTLGNDSSFITDVNGVFGITDSGLMGSFWMQKDSIYTYAYTDKGISGNISFGTPPLNCLSVEFPTGVNLFEFTLNNAGVNIKGQETIDISNVAGANSIGKFSVTDKNWISNGKKVMSFYNDTLYGNLGLVGVYPFKCDTCTGSKNPPACLDATPSATSQKHSTCNVSRSAKLSGGKVHISFLGYTK